ncbi:MAG: SpoIIE family protein phosphatase [Phycisphaerae bacterium]|nr:SpoIIE family protein phosphatase [Phycisphaerae bacterium]
MRIRWKLLLLLLATALLPMGFLAVFQNRSWSRLGHELGYRTRETLVQRAGQQLLQLAQDHARSLRREVQTLNLAVRTQAREAGHCLSLLPPADPAVFWTEQYDQADSTIPGLVRSEQHFQHTPNGEQEPVLVTYDAQVFVSAPGVDRSAVEEDVARLSSMVDVYRSIRAGHAESLYWQHTALVSGVHSSYPGHGGYPDAFDPRQRLWFTNALAEGKVTGNPPFVDTTTGEVVFTTSAPIIGRNGEPVGVTGIDVSMLDIMRALSVPTAWSADADVMLLLPAAEILPGDDRVMIVAQQSYLDARAEHGEPIEREYLTSENAAELQALAADLSAGRSGLRQMPGKGRDCLWAYALADRGVSVCLVVPHHDIVEEGVEAETRVIQRTRHQLELAGIFFAVAALVVLALALWGSRSVTRPIAELADVAEHIAVGDFKVRATVRSRDELGDLARTVNEMLPQLEDRMRLRHSLTLAKEVQQTLLPGAPPQIEGLDVSGTSIYCDETGGDYYDFVELRRIGPRCLAVAVGDVTGHGIAPALLMASARALLRSRIGQAGGLGLMLGEVNRQVHADSSRGRFMTLFLGVLDPDTRTIRWVCAGHDPPITYDVATGSFGELRGGDLPLGITDDTVYEEYRASLPAGERVIVIGTDGIWEASNEAGEMFGKDRLREVLRSHATQPAEAIRQAITDAVVAFRGSHPQEDDITLVVVKVL